MVMAISELVKQKISTDDQEIVVIDSGQECPDCQDSMTQFYDGDDLAQFSCENCGYEIKPRIRSNSDYQLGY